MASAVIAGVRRLVPAVHEGEGVAFSWPVALLSTAWLAGLTYAWYDARGAAWTATPLVPALFAGGAALFFLLVWIFRGRAPWQLRRETVVVAVTAIALLAVLWLWGREGTFRRWAADRPFDGQLAPLYPFFYFVASCVLWRSVLPLAIGRTMGRPSSDYGWRFRGTFDLWWVYLLAVLAVVPFVVWASTQASFLARYPLCNPIIRDESLAWGHFIAYQLSYGLVFASGESFWRGYMLFGLARELGYLSLFFMVGPYVISHFGKPMPETFGAIATGLFLGYLALRHRSFWLGVAAHWSIALMMDVFALLRRGVTLT